MKYSLIADKYKVSKVGLGGHYKRLEEGVYDNSYALLTKEEMALRREIISRAYEGGINYFDTTWRNESDMLASNLYDLGIKNGIFINGMVLGAFSGSKVLGETPCEYVDRWLNDRLCKLRGYHYNSFMINAIEEDYDGEQCAILVDHLENRRRDGDFDVLGISCHDHFLARRVVDAFPQIKLVMTAYNYKNRTFEEAFKNYVGNASFVAMKPLIWFEYGIPICRVNDLPAANRLLGGSKDHNLPTRSIRWILSRPLINLSICAVNSIEEVDALIASTDGELSDSDCEVLEAYRQAAEKDNHLPFLIAGVLGNPDNSRSMYYGLKSLSDAIGVPMREIRMNVSDTEKQMLDFRDELFTILEEKGLKKYME